MMTGTHEELPRRRRHQSLRQIGYQLPNDMHLTPTEFAVAKLLALGKKHAEIGQVLGSSVKTIDTHRGHVLMKLDLRNNVELALWAVRRGIVKVELDPDVVVVDIGSTTEIS